MRHQKVCTSRTIILIALKGNYCSSQSHYPTDGRLNYVLNEADWNLRQYLIINRLHTGDLLNKDEFFYTQFRKCTYSLFFLTHCGRVTQICVFTLQLCKTDDANLRF